MLELTVLQRAVRTKKLHANLALLQLSASLLEFKTLKLAEIAYPGKLPLKVQAHAPLAKPEHTSTKTTFVKIVQKEHFQLVGLKMNVNFVQKEGLQTKDEQLALCAPLENTETNLLGLTMKQCAPLALKDDLATPLVLSVMTSVHHVPKAQLFWKE